MEPGLQPELFKITYWTAQNKNQLMCCSLEVLLTVILLTEPECYYHPIISMVSDFLAYTKELYVTRYWYVNWAIVVLINILCPLT